jgi:hypothetical protein
VPNPNGCNPNRSDSYASSWSNIATNSFTGIFNRETELPVSTYPNPADNRLNITVNENLKGTVRIVLSDLLGNSVYTADLPAAISGSVYPINISEFREGLYMLRISAENGGTTRKIVIKH